MERRRIRLTDMKPVRLGIIGMGNIGAHHAEYLLAGKIKRCELKAVSDAFVDKLAPCQQRGLKVFGDGEELIRSGEVDAVIIATPHFQHTTLGIAALKAGLHVMVEKPDLRPQGGCRAADCRAPAASQTGFRRHVPNARRIALPQDQENSSPTGSLGEIVRISWIITEWFRTEAYYASGGWRATWKGEGGGVLINQCLHQFDMLQWLLGMPARVRCFVQSGPLP